MSDHEKTYIFFDTNALECRHSGKSLFLSQFTVNPLYYEIEKMIQDFGLSDKVKICIPEIVWFEMQAHLVSHFKSEKSSMLAKIESYRKSFGDLVELSCVFKDYNDEEQYKEYADAISKDFLENPRVTATIMPCPKDEETISQIIGQAVHSVKPFKTAIAKGGKEYTDAGFKDALIFNTLRKNIGDQLGILISNDNDFADLFNENRLDNLHLCRTAKEVQEILSKEFDIVTLEMVASILQSDDYLMRRILTETEFDEDATYDIKRIKTSINTEDGIKAGFIMSVNGEIYIFEILYNVDANELIEATCELFDESEDK